ncbi:hypothetical protein [Curtobacterium sp. BH-2-1-1]|uniref:hypothetical protein n=1 Tax=Curtobacterium sp. BH-2-1-1 TaxID=1905847 RepID=UPI0011A4AF8E|nr:hypothetical protein [Curtobacterium sp. BH-2-1-1]
MSTTRFIQLEQNLQRARDLVGLGQAVESLTHDRLEGSEMYRASWSLAVGAFDSYVHGVVLDRSVQITLGSISGFGVHRKIGLTLAAVRSVVTAGSAVDQELAARAALAQRLRLETFQKAEDVSGALAMVGVSKVWSTAFADSKAAQQALNGAVNRRNAIVHQCDADPLSPTNPSPITADDSLETIEVIRRSAAGIDSLL